jgi:hypothetical protein
MKKCNNCEELEGFVKYRDDKIIRLEKALESKDHEYTRLNFRLDACLYAMILMQKQVQADYHKIVGLEKLLPKESLSLATL